jgi:hypothetical protein
MSAALKATARRPGPGTNGESAALLVITAARRIIMSWKKGLLAVAAVAVVAATFVPTEASARWRGRGWGWGGPALGIGLGLGLAGAGYYGGYYGGYPAYGYGYGYPAYGGCWRRQVFYTPYGPRARRVWVCG